MSVCCSSLLVQAVLGTLRRQQAGLQGRRGGCGSGGQVNSRLLPGLQALSRSPDRHRNRLQSTDLAPGALPMCCDAHGAGACLRRPLFNPWLLPCNPRSSNPPPCPTRLRCVVMHRGWQRPGLGAALAMPAPRCASISVIAGGGESHLAAPPLHARPVQQAWGCWMAGCPCGRASAICGSHRLAILAPAAAGRPTAAWLGRSRFSS